jgi:hypothetical protein
VDAHRSQIARVQHRVNNPASPYRSSSSLTRVSPTLRKATVLP